MARQALLTRHSRASSAASQSILRLLIIISHKLARHHGYRFLIHILARPPKADPSNILLAQWPSLRAIIEEGSDVAVARTIGNCSLVGTNTDFPG